LASDGWETVLLGELCKFTKGSSPTQKTLPGQYPLIVTGPAPLSSADYQFEGEAVCVPMVSSTGHGHASLKRVHYASGKFAVANIVTACEVKNPAECSTRFLHIYLQHYKDELIVPRMQGTANVSLSKRELAQVPVRLPSLAEQRRIVDLIGAVDNAVQVNEISRGLAADALVEMRGHVFSPGQSTFQTKVGDHLTRRQRAVKVEPDSEYVEVGVRSHGRGVFIKDPVEGSVLAKKKVFYLDPGLLVFNVVFAWEGAVAVLGPEVSGMIASHRFPTYDSDDLCGVEILDQYFRTEQGRRLLLLCSPGGAGRNKTLNQKALLSSTVTLPEISTWADVVSLLGSLESRVLALDETLSSLRLLRTELLSSLLSGAHRIPETYDELMGA
jgi:type I restriction enzyme S subunit